MDCKCTLAQRAVGDGCDVCNPTQALEYAREEIESLRQQLAAAEAAMQEVGGSVESNKAVERALDDVDYRGTYADGVLYLKRQVASMTKERDEYKLKNKLHAEQADMYGKEASRHEDTIEFATEYALNTAKYLHQHFYSDVTQWEPLDDLIGLQTQISNMVTGVGEQLAAALAACEAKHAALEIGIECANQILSEFDHAYRHHPAVERERQSHAYDVKQITNALAIKPDASALKARDEALIERCAKDAYELWIREPDTSPAVAILELKGKP